MSVELSIFNCAKIKVEVKNENQNFLLPHINTKKDDGSFANYVFYTTTTIQVKGEDGNYSPRYKQQKMVCWNEKLANKFQKQIEGGATHFSGLCDLKKYHPETIKDNEDKEHKFYENFEYQIIDGNCIKIVEYSKDNNKENSKFSNYSTETPITDENTTEQQIVDDDIPF